MRFWKQCGVVLTTTTLACSDQLQTDGPLVCDINTDWVINVTTVDRIPSLTNPTLVNPDHQDAAYLLDTDRVMGLVVAGTPIAVPHNIQWWHEIVNLNVGDVHLAITHCPLTGSSLTFDRGAAGNAEFGVSGLLFMNNLMMYNRSEPISIWPQMSRSARCGDQTGTPLAMVPSIDMTWIGWKSLHPDTKVVGSNTGVDRDYRLYPYGDYRDADNLDLLFNIPGKSRLQERPPKELILGIPAGDSGGLGFPFGELDKLGAIAVATAEMDGRPIVVFYDRVRSSAAAYFAETSFGETTFRTEGGQILDNETDSAWRIDGLATGGVLAGETLVQVRDSFISYWFAWMSFHPKHELWIAP